MSVVVEKRDEREEDKFLPWKQDEIEAEIEEAIAASCFLKLKWQKGIKLVLN